MEIKSLLPFLQASLNTPNGDSAKSTLSNNPNNSNSSNNPVPPSLGSAEKVTENEQKASSLSPPVSPSSMTRQPLSLISEDPSDQEESKVTTGTTEKAEPFQPVVVQKKKILCFTQEGSEQELPESLSAAIGGRLDALPPIDKLLLKTVAALGENAPLALIKELYPIEEVKEVIPQHLDELVDKGLLVVTVEPAMHKYVNTSLTYPPLTLLSDTMVEPVLIQSANPVFRFHGFFYLYI